MTKENFRKTAYNTPLVEQRADPFVYKHMDGYYYFTASVPEYDRIILRKSKEIKGIVNAKEVVVWNKHDTGIMGYHIWAPEIHYLDGKWYIYFAAGEAEKIWQIRPYVLMCKDENPLTGEWEELGMMQCANEDEFSFRAFSLDATVFEHNGKKYYIWAEKVGVGKMISNLYIAEMETPWKLKTVQVLLTTPDYDWERVMYWVDEGPAILKHDNRIFLAFSASGTGACYCVGLMYADADADLLDPASWRKVRYPVLKTDEEKGIYGPGHNSFTKSEDGTKDIMIFHARQYDEIVGDPLRDPNRHTMMLEVEWNDDGMPVFEFQKQDN
ncbi:glycosyl hydrolase [Anaerocolumna cellulosilytica]|uniref:Glycosyl hydrolase n=1 Tax=Anaerocolumna cellulosilytica TaxID=433286 RepID=A0A6S6QXD3_9FIRM|nr:glycoside hydrolase family 43 protein [Anaerocolumna cellulosilytica]MBB5197092.1 GH43 family beta-xylosidase [Anaerocolumna cellulosilytica]BCJ95304.1 glycosyl hydrolase [Anaerocolumna cellulosilytica]